MEYVILSIPKEKGAALGRLVQDDLVSRQTIAVREGEGLGIESKDTFVMIEGAEEALSKARELLGDDGKVIEGNEREDIYKKIKEAEDQVAEGLGLMFG
jgi:hypothetical protein